MQTINEKYDKKFLLAKNEALANMKIAPDSPSPSSVFTAPIGS
jgi:hypothetical protein